MPPHIGGKVFDEGGLHRGCHAVANFLFGKIHCEGTGELPELETCAFTKRLNFRRRVLLDAVDFILSVALKTLCFAFQIGLRGSL